MTKTAFKGQSHQAAADSSVADANATVVLPGEQGCEDTCLSNQQPTNACEEAVRALAHSKWEAAGCPTGDGFDFWLEAEREVSAEKSSRDSTQE